jgi:hypothetical protein
VRKVVISHPYAGPGQSATDFEVLELSPDGKLSKTNVKLSLGVAIERRFAFTPDGEVGLVAQDDGSIGVVRFDQNGAATVVHAAFKGSFYANALLVDDSGQRAYVLDGNWRNNGGGIYGVTIGCDGSLADEGLLAQSKLASTMDRLSGTATRALIGANDVLSSPSDQDAHLMELNGAKLQHVSSIAAFGDQDAIVSAVSVMPGDKHALIGDYNAYSGKPNRVAAVAISGNALSAVQVLSPIDDPVDIIASPYGNAALVLSGFSDALYRLSYNGASSTPFKNEGELSYKGSSPKLPAAGVLITRGQLKGRVLIAENVAVRQVQFQASGQITDLGAFAIGSGYSAIVGTIGVQP